MVRFRSNRRRRMGFFETEEWSLKMEDGSVVQLLEANQPDPFKAIAEEEERANKMAR